MVIETHGEHASFGGQTGFYSHRSESCSGEMRFAVYTPPRPRTGPCLSCITWPA